MQDSNKISRRKLLKNLPQGLAVLGMGGFLWGTALKSVATDRLVLRPPGALPEKDFLKACLKCGLCVTACPYDTLKLAPASDGKLAGTPYFVAREIPCYLCTDYPCIKECPSKALSVEIITVEQEASINNSRMGLAIIHEESCIAYQGIHCSACYRACPLMGEAIKLVFDKNQQTLMHANLKPVVDGNICTGCGLCEHACIIEKAAIKVFPREVAEGKTGDHYLNSWNAKEEEKLKNHQDKKENNDTESTLDYLNNNNLLDNE